MIASVLRMMGKGRAEADGLELFTKLLFDSTLVDELAGMDEEALARFASASFAHLVKKPHKKHSIAFRQTELTAPAGTPPASVVEILDDDMPFLVESIVATLHAHDLLPRLVFHPIFKVKRYGSGRLQAVVAPGDRHWAGGDQESYFAAILDPIGEETRRKLTADLDIVLEDVRQAAMDGDAMRRRIAQAINAFETLQFGLSPAPGAPDPMEVREAVDFLKWLKAENFTLLGIRDFELVGLDDRADLWPSASGALGIARHHEINPGAAGEDQPAMSAGIRAVYAAPQPLIFSRTRRIGTVRRRVPLDRIGIKRYTPAGKLIGETRLYGLFTPASSLQSVEAMPVVRHKVRQVLAAAQFPPDSHNGRTLIDILETFPRDELLQIDMATLLNWSRRLLDLDLHPRTSVLVRRDDVGGSTSVMAFVPRDHYSSAIRERIADVLETTLGGNVTAFSPYITASPLVRTRFLLADTPDAKRATDETALEAAIVEIVTTWQERLLEAITRRGDPARDRATEATFREAFSAGYREAFGVDRALEDIARIGRLGPERPVSIDLYRDTDPAPHRMRAALYRFDQPIPLSERVPILENLGFRVIDERTYRIRPTFEGTQRLVVLHDMVLETADGAALDITALDGKLEDAFLAVFSGCAENDLFNALVRCAGLDWQQSVILRALAAFLRQIRAPFGPRYIAETLLRYPSLARDLIGLARARLDPLHVAAEGTAGEIRARFEAGLAAVTGLDEDRILRRLLSVVLAIVRTNAFLRDDRSRAPGVLGFKLASQDIDRMPEPKPFREIFVYSPRVEGVHLRFAPIARGGIRWSDRLQDFRTEVLGLAKAQQVKNAVIVPSGAKGGFVPKQLAQLTAREDIQAEGIACYKLFIATLLDLTDDIRDGAIIPPRGLVRLDSDDPYLVVAADKGTATFSDTANAIATERGFWLGDAFASGGSAGYDHKRLGITARGAWECVKRHFREMDIDIQRMPFRTVGVGDMSGDVFGNGMLLSDSTLLVAALDHRHIFLDPSPDAAVSFAERRRLFELPRSSWADYDIDKISPGGGVFSRSAKAIALSPEVKAMLGVEADTLPPGDLIQAILRCEVDLLWFGGIGTFVRETSETDDQVGDRSNDAIRITAAEVRAKVVGEGANLGFTQRARVEAASRGVRLNADFIDNSAGVNTSDQEVNIKIALEPAVAAGRLQRHDRNARLADMADEVAAHVLANNHAQGLAISLAERASARDLAPWIVLIRHLEQRGLVERRLEALPSGSELQARAKAGRGLTRPEIAVLLSFGKIALNADLLAGPLPDTPSQTARLIAYFPVRIQDAHRREIEAHRLRREIISTGVTNDVVNRGGPTLVTTLTEETGKPPHVIAERFLAINDVHGIERDWKELDTLDGVIAGGLQLEMYDALQQLAAEETRCLLAFDDVVLTRELEARRSAAEELSSDLAALLPAPQRTMLDHEVARLTRAGVPQRLAERHAGWTLYRSALAMSDLARTHGASIRETARTRLALLDYLKLDQLRERASALVAVDAFDQQAIEAALGVLTTAESRLMSRVLAEPAARSQNLANWIAEAAPQIAIAGAQAADVLAPPGFSIARLTLASDALRMASVSSRG